MTKRIPPLQIALAAAVDLPSDGEVPDWVHLIPAAQGEVRTFDGRGPYRVNDAQAIVAASFEDPRGLPIDENHSTYIAAPKGQSAPARGWIKAMEVRPDGIWGRVEWTDAGRELVASRAYRGLSPVLMHDKAGAIQRITCASLVNRPNLQGMHTLNQETTMSFMEKLAQLLGLAADASEAQILKAAKSKIDDAEGPNDPDKASEGKEAAQAALTEIGAALGVEGAADVQTIIAAAKAATSAKPAEIAALQSEIADLTTRLNTVTEGTARQAATAFVDGEIKRGRVGLKPLRDRYITMHMSDAAGTEELINALPVIGRSGVLPTPPARKDGEVSLNAEQADAARLIGVDPKTYTETLQAERAANEGTL